MDCIFCKIVSGEASSYKIYEDKDTFAFLSIANDYYGHTLIVPKKHYPDIINCPAKVSAALIKTAQKIAKHYITLGFDGVNIFINNGAAADQLVFHLHVHIVPRKKDTLHKWDGETKRDFIKEQKFFELTPQS